MGIKYTTPSERIVSRDAFAAIFNVDKMLRDRKFLVDLACGHKAYTRNQNRMVCPRCTEMLRRSIADGGEDWESFRYRQGRDHMKWTKDPCRKFNEETDLAGNFSE